MRSRAIASRARRTFAGVITGASEKVTYVRTCDLPVEGRVMRGFSGPQVGTKGDVKLIGANFERGFLDFARD